MKNRINIVFTLLLMAFRPAANVPDVTLNMHSTARHQHDDSTFLQNASLDISSTGNRSVMGAKSVTLNRASYMPLDNLLKAGVATKAIAGTTRQGRQLEVYYYPGKTDRRALVIGGMHGSELSAIDVANDLLQQLQTGELPYYSVLVIPCLFPDNAASARTSPAQIGSVSNIGRYTSNTSVDPNRQMPALGLSFNNNNPVDYLGREIEMENRLLLDLIQQYRPTRIVNLHAIRDIKSAGVFADPRTDHNGYALGFQSDSNLAINMAKYIQENGGHVAGNQLDCNATALYRTDPPAVLQGQWQRRNFHGSHLPCNKGRGISLGSWASTAVRDPNNEAGNRQAIRLITMEFPGCKRWSDYDDPLQQQKNKKLVKLYALAIKNVFLGKQFEEGEERENYFSDELVTVK